MLSFSSPRWFSDFLQRTFSLVRALRVERSKPIACNIHTSTPCEKEGACARRFNVDMCHRPENTGYFGTSRCERSLFLVGFVSRTPDIVLALYHKTDKFTMHPVKKNRHYHAGNSLITVFSYQG